MNVDRYAAARLGRAAHDRLRSKALSTARLTSAEVRRTSAEKDRLAANFRLDEAVDYLEGEG